MAVEDGYRESEASWHEVLVGLRSRGQKEGPKLAVGDGPLGFWNALRKEYPECVHPGFPAIHNEVAGEITITKQ